MKYIFIDVDGTMYSPKINGVVDSTKLALKQAKANGHKIFLCTGRSLAESKLFLNLDIDGFIFCAGTLVYCEGKRIYEKAFNSDRIDSIIKMCDNNNFGYCLEAYAGAYYNDVAKPFLYNYFGPEKSDEETNEIMQDNCIYNLDYYHHKDPVTKINAYGATKEQLAQLKTLVPNDLDVTTSLEDWENNTFCAEITDREINKATGIQHILNCYPNATFDDVIALGDSDNDISMVSKAKIGIAMGNASASLKAVSDYVTDDILDDGLYNAFKHYKLI